MTRAIALAITLSACTQPAPCVATEPAPATIDLHSAESVTSAGLEQWLGSELEGKAQ